MTIWEILSVTIIVSIVILHILSAYNAAMDFGDNNTRHYTASMIATNKLEENKWNVIQSGNYTTGVIDSGTIERDGATYNYVVELQDVTGSGLYSLHSIVHWKNNSVPMSLTSSTLIAIRN